MTHKNDIPQDYLPEDVDSQSHEQLSLKNEAVITQYDQKYLPKKITDITAPWFSAGAVQSVAVKDNSIHLICDNGRIECRWIDPETVRLRFKPQSDPSVFEDDPFSYAVESINWTPVHVTIHDDNDEGETSEPPQISVVVDNQAYLIDRDDFRLIAHSKSNGHLYSVTPIWREDGAVGLRTQLADDEACYGTGERAFNLNLRGRKLALWNVDPGGYRRGDDPINTSIPFYMGVHNNGTYGVLWDNSHRGSIDCGHTNPGELLITGEAGECCAYFFGQSYLDGVMKAYTGITGRMPLPPLWALGYQQSRYSYMSQQEVLSIAREFRQRRIPCDVIYLDIHYMDEYRIFTWDKERFPDLPGMILELHEMGFKIVPIIDPGVKIDNGYSGYTTGVAEDIFLKYPDGEPAAGVVWPGLCHFPDFDNAQTHEWWAQQLRPLLEAGIDGIWNDMNEPVIFRPGRPGEIPDYVVHRQTDGSRKSHLESHNAYGTLMGTASRSALDQQRSGKRQLSIVRAAYAGSQRVVSGWTGDNHSTWDDLRLSISVTLNMALSGFSFTGPDVGGFGEDCDGELLARWTQAACLLPYFRNHSAIHTANQEPWQFGQAYEDVCREAIELRYKLLPYLYTAFAQYHLTGKPIIQPVCVAEPENPHLRNVDDCYLVGDSLLVAPVMHPHALRRMVYLPEGNWYDFWTHEHFTEPGYISIEAPLTHLPLFVRGGTVLPMWPPLQHAGERKIDTLTLRIYADSGNSSLYEDAGEGLAYQNGDHRWTYFTCEETSRSLTVSQSREGSYKPDYKKYRIEMIGATHPPQQVIADDNTLIDWVYSDGVLSVEVSDFDKLTIST